MYVIGLDVGYSHVKTVTGSARSIFPSIVGSADLPRFGVEDVDYIVLEGQPPVLVGQGAVDQSRFSQRQEDRGWIHTQEYTSLFLAALSETTQDLATDICLITGLPLAYFADAQALRDSLGQAHIVHRRGRAAQTFTVIHCRVIPQPFGSLFSLALTQAGGVARPEYLTDLVGVVDVGGHTTNILTAIGGREQVRATTSVPSGAWDVVRAVREDLATLCAGLDLSGHQLSQAVTRKSVSYFGQDVDLTSLVEGASRSLSQRVIASASQLWGTGAELRYILVTGGGAHLVGPAIVDHFSKHQSVTVLEDPVFANAVGYYRFGRYLEERGAW